MSTSPIMSLQSEIEESLVPMEAKKWVEDLKDELPVIASSNEEQVWARQSIYRVPARIKDGSITSFEPQMVSIGPYHHGKPQLKPMEHHKRRALARLVERSNKSIQDFAAALEQIAEDLMGAYEELDEEWRNKDKFLTLMLIDGCFLLEIMRGIAQSYAPFDPIFSLQGVLNTFHFIIPDMFMVENQIPLLALARLLSVESDMSTREGEVAITSLVIKLFFPGSVPNPEMELRRNMLDIYRGVLVDHDPWPNKPYTPKIERGQLVRSATELWEAGVTFRKSQTCGVKDIAFEYGVLSVPLFSIEHGLETIFRNVATFERLRPGTSHDFRTYLMFMFGLVNSVEDVALLRSQGMIETTLGSDEAVAQAVKELAKDILIFDPNNRLCAVRDSLNEYHARNMMKWSRRCRDWHRKLLQSYFSNPWTFISVLAAALLLGLTLVQTYYSARTYYKN